MMKMRFSFYKQHLRKKLYNKILLIYSCITIGSLLAMAFLINYNLTQTLQQKELSFNKQVLGHISDYFNQKYYLSLNILQQIYVNREVSSDLIYFLRHDYNEYIANRLDLFSKSSTDIFNSFQTYFKSCYSRDQDIHSIILYSREKNFVYIASEASGPGFSKFTPQVQKLVMELSNNKSLYYPYLFTGLDPSSKTGQVYTTVSSIKDPITLENIGALIINYDIGGIYNSYQKYAKDIKGYILILTRTGTVLFDSSNRYYGSKYPYFSLLKENAAPRILNEKSFINLIHSPISGAVIAGIVPQSQLLTGTRIMNRAILLITFLLAAFSIVLTYFGMKIFSKRTQVIMQGINELKHGNLKARIPVDKSEDELAQIAESFNVMCDSLQDYINRVYLSEIKQKNAELTALQNQINPHFLYNTLEIIRMEADSKGVRNVGQMIYLIATLFRNYTKSGTIITIGDEIELCRLYLQLFNLKYQNKLTFTARIPAEIINYSIIKFSLQPIIENCLVHGIDRDIPGSVITLEGFKEQNEIHILIRDNGAGISIDKLNALKEALKEGDHYPSSTIGLSNVNERLRMVYGRNYGLSIESEAKAGTTVELVIPALKKEDLREYVQGVLGG